FLNQSRDSKELHCDSRSQPAGVQSKRSGDARPVLLLRKPDLETSVGQESSEGVHSREYCLLVKSWPPSQHPRRFSHNERIPSRSLCVYWLHGSNTCCGPGGIYRSFPASRLQRRQRKRT